MVFSLFKKPPRDPKELFLTTIKDFGLLVDKVVIEETICWCQTTKSSAKKGFYILQMDKNDQLHGMFGTYAKGDQHEWHQESGGHGGEKIRKLFAKVKSDVDKKRIKARIDEIVKKASPLPSDDGHPYLKAKCIGYPGGMVYQKKLVVPFSNARNEVVAIQLVDVDGKKTNVNSDGAQGSYLCLCDKVTTTSKQPKIVYVCSDFQTAATIRVATKCPVFCARYFMNLKPVLLRVQKKYPRNRLVFVSTAGVAGKDKKKLDEARNCAREINAVVVEPVVTSTPKKRITFNDVLITHGLDAVKEQLRLSAKAASKNSKKGIGNKTGPVLEAEKNIDGSSQGNQVKASPGKAGSTQTIRKEFGDHQSIDPSASGQAQLNTVNSESKEDERDNSSGESGQGTTGVNASGIPEWPIPDPAMFEGFAGEFVNAAVENSEADPVAVLITFLSRFGVEIGRDVYKYHPEKQPGKINAVLVGASGMARKGTSAIPVKELFNFESSSSWKIAATSNGPLSSGEGIIEAVKDPEMAWLVNKETSENEWVVKTPGVDDKRLLVIEGEFANALDSMQRKGNTLSNIIRCMYDGNKLAPMTKRNKISATDHHVAIVAHVTQDELMKKLARTECYNGFVNRFLWMCVRRGEPCAFPTIMEAEVLGNYRKRLLKILHWSEDHRGAFEFSQNAAELWEEKYLQITDLDEGIMSQILSRGATHTIRLSLIYAVLDCSEKIRQRHLERALAVWLYATDSARYVFGELDESKYSRKILSALKDEPGGLTSTQIHRVFGNHVDNKLMRNELGILMESGLVHSVKQKTKGAPKKVYILGGCPKKDS